MEDHNNLVAEPVMGEDCFQRLEQLMEIISLKYKMMLKLVGLSKGIKKNQNH